MGDNLATDAGDFIYDVNYPVNYGIIVEGEKADERTRYEPVKKGSQLKKDHLKKRGIL